MKPIERSKLSQQEATFVGAKSPGISNYDVGEIVIKIIQGLHAGKEFTFAVGQKIIIGRQDDAHICFNHNLVSRHHSRIEWREGEPWIVDLKSTNGTFVNEKKIREEKLEAGCKVKIGNSVMKVDLHRGEEGEKTRLNRLIHTAEELLSRVEQEKDQWGRIFSGALEKVTLAEVLQSIAMGKNEGILVVRGPDLGKIYMRQGSIFYAKTGEVTGMKALFRMLSWEKGHFDLRALKDELIEAVTEDHWLRFKKDFPGDMTQTLLEFFKSQDEFAPLKDKIPKSGSMFMANAKKPFVKKNQYERVFRIYEKASGGMPIEEILDAFPLLDTEILRVLIFLTEKRYLLPASGAV